VYPSLQDFVAALEKAGELHRVSAPVSPLLEIAEIADRQCKAPCPNPSEAARAFDPRFSGGGGKALLFENVEGCDFPVLINAYGSYRRTEMALNCVDGGFEAIAARLASLTKPEPPKSLGDLFKKAREFLPLLRVPPKRVRGGPCQEVVLEGDRIDLRRIPLLKCWPLDGDPAAVGYPWDAERAGTAGGDGRYLTFGGIHTIHARDIGERKPSSHNVGMYRLQLLGPNRLAMHWHMHHDGAAHWRSWKARGERMPVAISLGGEAVMPYAATAPLPPGISELLMAGFLHGKGIRMTRAKTVPLWVPANAEIVIEGFVSTECGPPGFDPREDHGGTDGDASGLGPGAVFEGPFGDHTGFYSLPDRYPVVEVTAVTHRRDAIYPTTIVGLPPQEDYYLGKATERVFLPRLKTIVHDIADYHLPLFGCFHNCAFVAIRKEYPLQARRVMSSIWGAGQMAWTKVVVVVDHDVDVHDEEAVWRAVFENGHFGRDLEMVNGPLDILDHAAPRLGAGHKLGIDATRKVPGEEVHGVPHDAKPPHAETSPAPGIHFPAFGAGRCAFVHGDVERGFDAGADLVIAVDDAVDLADSDAVLFHWCANFDPGRDVHWRDHRVGWDARPKKPGETRNGQPARDFPPILEMDEETKAKVDRRWTEYGL